MLFNRTDTLQETTIHETNGIPLAKYMRQLKAEKKDQIPLHWHKEYQLIWLKSGQMDYQINRKTLHLEPNSFVFINAESIHGSPPVTTDCLYLCLDFSQKIFPLHLQRLLSSESISFKEIPYKKLTVYPEEMKRITSLFQEDITTDKGQFRETSLLLELMESVLFSEDKEPVLLSDSSQLIYRLLEFVHQNYQQTISVDSLADLVHINKNKCTELFKKYTQLSPINYVIHYRLLQAKYLLLESNLSISEICLAVGFNHVSYFSERFKQAYELTPLHYRKQFKKEP